jgi:hypothetical protein
MSALRDYLTTFKKSPRQRIVDTIVVLYIPCIVLAVILSYVGYFTGHGGSWGTAAGGVVLGMSLLGLSLAATGGNSKNDQAANEQLPPMSVSPKSFERRR